MSSKRTASRHHERKQLKKKKTSHMVVRSDVFSASKQTPRQRQNAAAPENQPLIVSTQSRYHPNSQQIQQFVSSVGPLDDLNGRSTRHTIPPTCSPGATRMDLNAQSKRLSQSHYGTQPLPHTAPLTLEIPHSETTNADDSLCNTDFVGRTNLGDMDIDTFFEIFSDKIENEETGDENENSARSNRNRNDDDDENNGDGQSQNKEGHIEAGFIVPVDTAENATVDNGAPVDDANVLVDNADNAGVNGNTFTMRLAIEQEMDRLLHNGEVVRESLNTYQGRVGPSNGCAVIAPLIVSRHLRSPMNITLLQTMDVIDRECPPLLSAITDGLGVREGTLLEALAVIEALSQREIMQPVCRFQPAWPMLSRGGNILDDNNIDQILQLVSEGPDDPEGHVRGGRAYRTSAIACVLTVCSHVISIYKGIVPDSERIYYYELVESLLPRGVGPNDPEASKGGWRMRFYSLEALRIGLKWYSLETRFTDHDYQFIAQNEWDERRAMAMAATGDRRITDPRTFEAFVFYGGNKVAPLDPAFDPFPNAFAFDESYAIECYEAEEWVMHRNEENGDGDDNSVGNGHHDNNDDDLDADHQGDHSDDDDQDADHQGDDDDDNLLSHCQALEPNKKVRGCQIFEMLFPGPMTKALEHDAQQHFRSLMSTPGHGIQYFCLTFATPALIMGYFDVLRDFIPQQTAKDMLTGEYSGGSTFCPDNMEINFFKPSRKIHLENIRKWIHGMNPRHFIECGDHCRLGFEGTKVNGKLPLFTRLKDSADDPLCGFRNADARKEYLAQVTAELENMQHILARNQGFYNERTRETCGEIGRRCARDAGHEGVAVVYWAEPKRLRPAEFGALWSKCKWLPARMRKMKVTVRSITVVGVFGILYTIERFHASGKPHHILNGEPSSANNLFFDGKTRNIRWHVMFLSVICQNVSLMHAIGKLLSEIGLQYKSHSAIDDNGAPVAGGHRLFFQLCRPLSTTFLGYIIYMTKVMWRYKLNMREWVTWLETIGLPTTSMMFIRCFLPNHDATRYYWSVSRLENSAQYPRLSLESERVSSLSQPTGEGVERDTNTSDEDNLDVQDEQE